MSLGPWEIALIFLVVLLVFGAKRIPEIARGLGKGIREFKDASTDIKRELTITDTPAPPQQIQPPAQQPMQASPPQAQPPVEATPQPQQQAPAPAPQKAPPPAEGGAS